MGLFSRRRSSKKKAVDPRLAPYMPRATAEYHQKNADEVEYEIKQSTITAEAWKETQGKWTVNTQTRKSHKKTEKYLRQLARRTLEQKPLTKTLEKLAADFDLGSDIGLPAALLSWPALHREFAALRRDYRGQKTENPEYRLVRQLVQERMPTLLEELSVESYRVTGGYQGQPFGFWPKDDPGDVAHRYAHMVLRALWLLWTDAKDDPKVRWLRNPAFVGSVDAQVYMLYHALLYRQFEEEETLRMRERDGKGWLARMFSC